MLKRLFFKKKEIKKPKTVEENMLYMASLGVAPDKLMAYQKICDKIENTKGVNS